MPKCISFQDSWLTDNEFKAWITRDTNSSHKARCVFCHGLTTKNTINIETMGRTALISHAKSEKHKTLLKNASTTQSTLNPFLKTPSSTSALSSTSVPPSSSSTSITNLFEKSDVARAEAIWLFQTIDDNRAFICNEQIGETFKLMFPDSQIARYFSLGKTKTMYNISHGIAPYLTSLLEEQVRGHEYVLLFDETMNIELQKKQMDCLLRFWDGDKVSSRYYRSTFVGHSTASDLYTEMEEVVERSIGYNKLLQISMDGPHVNWSLFNKMQDHIMEKHNVKLVNIGTCGLHIIHNSLQHGAEESGWNVDYFLKSLYRLFHDSPARREDFTTITGSMTFPQYFVSTRWVDNKASADRSKSMLPHLKVFVKEALLGKKTTKINPDKHKSFSAVKDFISDPLCAAKLSFFRELCNDVEPLLVKYQSDQPLLPFLAKDIHLMSRTLLGKIVKRDILDATPNHKLHTIDLTSNDNLTDMQYGFVTSEAKRNTSASPRQLLQFQEEAKCFLLAVLSKFFLKSPARYALVRNMDCLDPSMIMNKENSALEKRFKHVLDILISCGQVAAEEADVVLRQYVMFLGDVDVKSQMRSAAELPDMEKQLDKLYHKLIGNNNSFTNLWSVLRKLLILSHGQASVERSFSLNKSISTYNLSPDNLCSRRLVKDYIVSVGGVKNVVLTKQMLADIAASSRKYREEQEKIKKEEERLRKRKQEDTELDSLKKRQKMISADITNLEEKAFQLSEEASSTGSTATFKEAHALTLRSRNLKEELGKVVKLIDSIK